MRALGVLLLLAAGVGWYLLEQDRMSPAALTVVEWETRLALPVPLYVPLIAAGVLLLVAGVVARRRAPSPEPAAPPPRRRPPSPASLPPGAGAEGTDDGRWVGEMLSRARRLPIETGASLQFDVADGVPVGLRLERMAPEAERRSLEAFAEFLSQIPTPPRVLVEVIGGSTQRPRHLLHRALRGLFAPDTMQVLQHGQQIDVLFFTPDDRWGHRKRVYLD